METYKGVTLNQNGDPMPVGGWGTIENAAFHKIIDNADLSSLTTNKLVKYNGTNLESGIVYDNGTNVGIGTATPVALLECLKTTEQLRLRYDGTYYTSLTVNSSGNLTIAPSGGITNLYGILSKANPAVNNIFNLRGKDETFPLLLEFDSFGHATDSTKYCFSIQSQEAGVGYTNLTLNWAGGNVLVGTKVSTGGKLESLATTEQLRLSYDGTKHTSLTVNSSGNFELTPSGENTIIKSELILNDNSGYTSFSVDSDSYLTITPYGGITKITGGLFVSAISSDSVPHGTVYVDGCGYLRWIAPS